MSDPVVEKFRYRRSCFVRLLPTISVNTGAAYVYGDVNCDGKISLPDDSPVLQYNAKLLPAFPVGK